MIVKNKNNTLNNTFYMHKKIHALHFFPRWNFTSLNISSVFYLFSAIQQVLKSIVREIILSN